MALRFRGIYAALTTPFVEGLVSLDRFEDNIGRYNEHALAGYVVLGSTGESVHLSDEESAGLVRAARSAAPPDRTLIVGTARESTRLTIEFTRRMADLGAQAALVRTPGYFRSRMDAEALKRHFLDLADASPIPVLIYNIPQNTGVAIDTSAVIALAGHPRIVGIKDSSGNLASVGEVVPQAGPDFDFLVGAGAVVLPALHMGASGAILAVADAVPGMCLELYGLFLEGRFREARRVQELLAPLNKALVPVHGIPGLKHALDRLGYFGGRPRSPLLPLSDKGKEEIDALLEVMGLVKG
jgi:4-hydroxy-2-oxoglutarate aldolase